MVLLTRRALLTGAGAMAGTLMFSGYAIAVEPEMIPLIRHYSLAPQAWPEGLSLRVGVIADLHACEPWMSAERIRGIVEQTNALSPDLIVLLGDFNAGHRFVTGPVMPGSWADALSALHAPLGTYAVLGNHDWWHGPVPGMAGGPEEVTEALNGVGIRVLENEAIRIDRGGKRFWLAGLADQLAYATSKRSTRRGADDLAATLKQVRDDAPVLMLAHEPYIFRHMPDRVSLTLSGHTHGGQIVLPAIGPIVTPSRRYNYGHIVESGRNLIVSGGLGTSGVPMRFGVPPEILDVVIGGSPPDLACQHLRSDHQELGTDLDAVEQVDNVDVAHADAARRSVVTDLRRLVRAVDAIKRVLAVRVVEVERASTQRVIRTAG